MKKINKKEKKKGNKINHNDQAEEAGENRHRKGRIIDKH